MRYSFVFFFVFLLMNSVALAPALRADTGPGSINNSQLGGLSVSDAVRLFPRADALGDVTEGLPTRPVYQGKTLLGSTYFSDEITPIPAYSGQPVSLLVAIGADATLHAIQLHRHEEPILVIGITEANLKDFLGQFIGLGARERVRIGAHNRAGYTGVDGITGATITAMVINSTAMKSAAKVADFLRYPVVAEQKAAPTVASAPASSGLSQSFDPLVQERWEENSGALIVLGCALLLLMMILFFQDWLVLRPALFTRVRITFLLFTLIYLGLIHKAQLSIVNVLAFLKIMIHDFTWSTLLLDPIIFLLWAFVAVSIIFWGRGVFCGWLCPFGAAQELLHKLSTRMGLPSWEFPALVHERLWAVKYFILIALVGLSLESMRYSAQLAELEPFKTVFVLRFDRDTLFVLWAVFLLGISLFNSKFYCKYLCTLGAALSFFTRFRIFDWLRRRKECGSPCQSCAANCQISAIKPTGEIIDNECHYCLECQVTYWDEHRCPPLVVRREKREKRESRAANAKKPGSIIASDASPD